MHVHLQKIVERKGEREREEIIFSLKLITTFVRNIFLYNFEQFFFKFKSHIQCERSIILLQNYKFQLNSPWIEKQTPWTYAKFNKKK